MVKLISPQTNIVVALQKKILPEIPTKIDTPTNIVSRDFIVVKLTLL